MLKNEWEKKDLEHILNVLRRGTITWSKRRECLNRERKRVTTGKYKNGKEKRRWEYRCAGCRKYFRLDAVEVDHIEEVGPFCGDLNRWVKRLYCRVDNLQVLCVYCHKKKTVKYNARLRFTRKSRKDVLVEDDSHLLL